MKYFVSVAALTLVLAGCSTGAPGGSPTPDSTELIAVDETLTTVTITIPSSIMQMGDTVTQETVDLSVANSGFDSGVLNEDGSVTYTMSQAKHREILDKYAASVDSSIADSIKAEKSIKTVEHDDSFTKFTVTVDRADFENSLSAQFVGFGLALTAAMYQAFDGVGADGYRVTFDYVDADSGEVFDTAVYPDDFKD